MQVAVSDIGDGFCVSGLNFKDDRGKSTLPETGLGVDCRYAQATASDIGTVAVRL